MRQRKDCWRVRDTIDDASCRKVRTLPNIWAHPYWVHARSIPPPSQRNDQRFFPSPATVFSYLFLRIYSLSLSFFSNICRTIVKCESPLSEFNADKRNGNAKTTQNFEINELYLRLVCFTLILTGTVDEMNWTLIISKQLWNIHAIMSAKRIFRASLCYDK